MTPDRRQFLSSAGLGSVALMSLLHDDVAAAESHTLTHGPHLKPRAKNIVWLFMSGGPSQVDTWDPKPELTRLHRKDVPESIASNVPRLKEASLYNLMASPYLFSQHGESGLPVSNLLPAMRGHVDDVCVIRSMHHRTPVHGPGEVTALTGTPAGDRPSLGAWISYGLGAANQNLPTFIVMNLLTSGMQYPQTPGWSAGFLPARYQGVVVNPRTGIRDIHMPADVTDDSRRRQLQLIEWLNRRHLNSIGGHTELEARIQSYEKAFRMQSHAPELFDLEAETESTHAMYGTVREPTRTTGTGLLLARRMVERGVRFVQVRIGGWDAHGNLKGNHGTMAMRTDQPVAAFLTDLKQRGLLEDTLVVWGGEFGRTPTMEGLGNGRNHNPLGYSIWMAGGGVKGGQAIGATDELGYTAVERPVSISDLRATLLHALGIDQYRLTWHHHGRDELATNLGGDVVNEVFA